MNWAKKPSQKLQRNHPKFTKKTQPNGLHKDSSKQGKNGKYKDETNAQSSAKMSIVEEERVA